jgi:hypothetical protein
MAHQGIKDTFDRLWELHKAKDSDYAGYVPLSNFKQCERFGVPAWQGALIRMSDKWSRLMSVLEKGKSDVAGETIDDTLDDLAVYAVIVRVLRDEANATEML